MNSSLSLHRLLCLSLLLLHGYSEIPVDQELDMADVLRLWDSLLSESLSAETLWYTGFTFCHKELMCRCVKTGSGQRR